MKTRSGNSCTAAILGPALGVRLARVGRWYCLDQKLATSENGERELVLHSWCVQAEWDAPTIVGGSGARFFDASGRSYLDMSSLAECSNLGHQHPAVVRAIAAQAERLCFVTNAWGAEP